MEEHHIIPRSLGGTDDKPNLVKLTAKEHFICHLLLTKMYPKESLEYYKMCHAFFMMFNENKLQSRYISSKKYEKLKVAFSERMASIQTGTNNSQYGTMWIHNKELKQCIKVSKDSTLEEGWEKGRVVLWNRYYKKCIICKTDIFGKRKNICNVCNKIKQNNINLDNFSKKCSIEGIIYNSVTEAAKKLGIKRNTLQYRIYSINYEEYFYINSSIV